MSLDIFPLIYCFWLMEQIEAKPQVVVKPTFKKNMKQLKMFCKYFMFNFKCDYGLAEEKLQEHPIALTGQTH